MFCDNANKSHRLNLYEKRQKMLFFCKHLPWPITMMLFMCLSIPILDICFELGDKLFIIQQYGNEAYSKGLRVEDDRHGILNNGKKLTVDEEILRIILIFFPLFIGLFTIIPSTIWFCDLCFYWYQRKKSKGKKRELMETE